MNLKLSIVIGVIIIFCGLHTARTQSDVLILDVAEIFDYNMDSLWNSEGAKQLITINKLEAGIDVILESEYDSISVFGEYEIEFTITRDAVDHRRMKIRNLVIPYPNTSLILELYPDLDKLPNNKRKYQIYGRILWGKVHADCLFQLNISKGVSDDYIIDDAENPLIDFHTETPKVDCKDLDIETDKCDIDFTRKNLFGIEEFTFTENKTIYVLDFETEKRYPTLYKISKKKMRNGKWKNKPKGNFIPKGSLFLIPLDSGNECLHWKDNVEVLINNVNKFRYNVSVEDTAFYFKSEPPFLLKEIFLGESTGIAGTLVNSLSANMSTTSKAFQTETDLDQLIEAVKCFDKHYNTLVDRVICSISRCLELPCCIACNNVYSELAKNLSELHYRIDKIVANEGSVRESVERQSEIIKNCEKLKKLRAENKMISKELKDAKEKLGNLQIRQESKEKITKAQKEVAEIEKRIKNNKSKLDAFSKLKIDCSEPSIKKVQKNIIELKQSLAVFKSLKIVKSRLPSAEELKKLVIYVNSMTRHSQQYTHMIPQLKGGELKIDIRIEAKNTIKELDPSSVSDHYHYTLQMPIIHRWYVSFSSGSFVGFGRDLQPKTYDWRELPGPGGIVGNGQHFELVESGYRSIPVGFAALMNVQNEISNGFSLGVSVGAGLPIRKPIKPSYMGGISISFGRQRQLVLTGGAMFTEVDLLNRSLSTGVIYSGVEDSDITYTQEFKAGPFLSLTYTPFKIYSSGKKKKRKKNEDE